MESSIRRFNDHKRSLSWQASLRASQTGEKSQAKGFEHTIKYGIVTDLVRLQAGLQKEHRWKRTLCDIARNICTPARKLKVFNQKTQINTIINLNIKFDYLKIFKFYL
jgi:hypothetical protein